MWLEDDVDLREAALQRSGQGSANLGGMMAVVVDDGDAVGVSNQLEATVDAVELRQPLANLLYRNIQPDANRDRGGSVADVVRSRHPQLELAQVRAAVGDTEATERCAFRGSAALQIRDAEVRVL